MNYIIRLSKNESQIVFGVALKRIPNLPVGSVDVIGHGDGTISLRNNDRTENIGVDDFYEASKIPFADIKTRTYVNGVLTASTQVGSTEAETVTKLVKIVGGNVAGSDITTINKFTANIIVDEARGDDNTADGTITLPFKTIGQAYANATDGDVIGIAEGVYTEEITLSHDKGVHFKGIDRNKVVIQAGATFDLGKDKNIFELGNTTSLCRFEFTGLSIKNCKYGIKISEGAKVKIDDCIITCCGWSSARLSTILSETDTWANGGTLGYDSSRGDLQSFYNSNETTNGGAIRISNVAVVEITNCDISHNFRGIRVEDCGSGGYGYISRNQSYNNVESGIYLAASTYNASTGCKNFTVYNNASKYNSNNGVLVIGGINNVVSLNMVEGNWNAGIMGWHVSNARFRDMDLNNNNRGQYNGIGNNGDASASIAIAGGTLNPGASFIADILDTQVYNTGLGASTSRIGLNIAADVSDINDLDKSLINIDDVGFKSQDFALDVDCDLDKVRLTLGDCRYIDSAECNVRIASGNYFELPFSNHHTNIKNIDFSLDSTGSQVMVKEGSNGDVLNYYGVNTLVAEAFGSKIRILLKNSSKIQLEMEVANTSINGSSVNSVLSQAITQINGLLSNTSGFSSGNPVTAFALSGNNLTLTLQDNTSYTVDVTTLGVDENKFVASGALNGSNLELTMNDSSVVSINAANMVNGSSLPAIANNWYISYGSDSGDLVTAPWVNATYKSKQPFYNGDFLEKGEEFIWTHDNSGTYTLGLYSGVSSPLDEVSIFVDANWTYNFKFSQSNGTVRETSVGTDVGTRYTSGYTITNNTVLALRYDIDNHVYLLDVSNDEEIIIGKTNIALTTSTVTISMGGDNTPTAKFPVMTKRLSQWEIVHDYDNSETSWTDGLEDSTILKSNFSVSPGEKFIMNMNFFGRNQRFGLGYSGDSSGVNNAHYDIIDSISYGTSEQFTDSGDWTFNTSNTYYNSGSGGYWWRNYGTNAGMISIIYNTDNSVDLYSEDDGEIIASKVSDLDGSPFFLHYGVNETTAAGLIPEISYQALGAGSQPLITFAPDVSDQVISITEGQSFSSSVALDSGSDIATMFGEDNAPSWAVLNQTTGVFTGTAPAYTGSSDDYVVSCKAANPLGGITSFNVTLRVLELTYTNTKSLEFEDGVNSYLGGNAALITSLERSNNGSGSGDAWTIAFWYKRTSLNQTGQTLFYFGSNDLANRGYIEVKQTGNGRVRLKYGSNNNYLQLVSGDNALAMNTWNQIVITYDGGSTGNNQGSLSSYYGRFKIYSNGTLLSTQNSHSNYGFSAYISGQNYRFGKLTNGNYPKDGLLNQLCIWGSDQSSNISGIYNGGNTQDMTDSTTMDGSVNSNYLPPSHYYEIDSSVSTISDINGTAHLVGYNFSNSDLVTDAP